VFEELKNVLCTTLILVILDFTKIFIIECDASGHGIGSILMQEGRPLAFISSELKGKNLLRPIYEK